MTVTLLLASLGGLTLGVYSMIRGVERPDPNRVAAGSFRQATRTKSHHPLPAAFAGGLIGPGALGSVLMHTGVASIMTLTLVALVAGAARMTTATWIVARWMVPAARRELDDPRYVLQGTLARVMRTIPPKDLGAVSYELDDRRICVATRILDGSAIARDADVVIERLEDAIVYVEPWSRVEERLVAEALQHHRTWTAGWREPCPTPSCLWCFSAGCSCCE